MKDSKAKDQGWQTKGNQVLSESPGLAQAPPALIMDFCGVISADEARYMIREIEEAFEQADGE